MMGSLDQPSGSNVQRKIAITNVNGLTAAQIESNYNTNFGLKGWRIVQVISISNQLHVIAEKEI